MSDVEIDPNLEPEIQTDKEKHKTVPCTSCGRALTVNQFYAAAKALCTPCRGESKNNGSGSKGTVAVVQAGRTEPSKSMNLTDTLVNPHFAMAQCPVHPDDSEHVMELKSVNHSPNRGPGYFTGKGYKQLAIGETAMHQCLKCKAVVTYSTTAMNHFRRSNEARSGDKHVNGWGDLLGTRGSE